MCGGTVFFPTRLDSLACAGTKKSILYIPQLCLSCPVFLFQSERAYSSVLTVVQEDTGEIALNKPIQGISRVKTKVWLQNPEVTTSSGEH